MYTSTVNILLLDSDNTKFTLSANSVRGRHILEILGLQPGNELRVGVLGRGLAKARFLRQTPGGQLAFELLPGIAPARRQLALRIIIGHPRLPVLARLVRDLAGMGVAQIDVVASKLTEKSYLSAGFWQKSRYAEELRLGAEQGVQVELPKLRQWYSVASLLGDLGEPPARAPAIASSILLSGGPGVPALSTIWKDSFAAVPGGAAGEGLTENHLETPATRGHVLAVGPERGFTEHEEAAFLAAGFERAALGSSILRTETAAILAAGFAAMQLTRD